MNDIKEYDWVIVGSGSASNLYDSLLESGHDHGNLVKMAVIEKDEAGGICLTRGCIPSKLLVYPAEIIRTIEHAKHLGINATYDVDFDFIMRRMRDEIGEDIRNITRGLTHSERIDFYPTKATFVDDYTLKVDEETIKGKNIILCLGSKPYIPPIKNLNDVGFLTSREFLKMTSRPQRMVIVGAGYIAAEYAHFMTAMGSEVTIFGRNKEFLKGFEPEAGRLTMKRMCQWMDIYVDHEVFKVAKTNNGKRVFARNRDTGEEVSVDCDEILVAAGRVSNSDLIKPEISGVDVDNDGWIVTNNRMQTSKENIWSFGDANGKYLLKHVGNDESIVALYNMFGHDREMSYHAIPAAVFTYPEVAAVGMTQAEAEMDVGRDQIKIGFQKYENTAKGTAMAVKDYFIKVILHKESDQILGATMVGPRASDLIQEVVNLMYTENRTPAPISKGMHIHPALSEVVQRAFSGYMDADQYNDFLLEEGYL